MLKYGMKYIFSILIICFLFITIAFSQNANKPEISFDAAKANKTFDAISIKLSTQNLKSKDLEEAVSTLEKLQNEAKTCLDNAQDRINEIDILLKSNNLDTQDKKKLADYQYLQNRKQLLQTQASECRVFVFRSQEAITAYKSSMQQFIASKLFIRSAPIWKLFSEKTTLSIQKFEIKKFFVNSGIQNINLIAWIIFILVIITGTIVGYALFRYCHWLFTIHDKNPSMYLFFIITLKHFAIPIILFGAISFYFTILFLDSIRTPSIEMISFAIFIFTLAIATQRFLFYPPEIEYNPLQLPYQLGKKFFVRLSWIASILLFSYIVTKFFGEQLIETHLQEIARTIYISIVSLSLIWVTWLFSELETLQKLGKSFIILFKSLLILLAILTISTEWLGYHALALFIIFNTLATVVLILVTWFLIRIIERLALLINVSDSLFSKRIRHYLGLRPYKKLPEMNLIQFLLYAIIAVAFFLLLLKTWGISTTFIDSLITSITEGFYIAGLKINLLRFAEALAAFILILLFGRITAAYVTHKHQFGGERDTQVAIATIINYISFTIAILVTLLVAGVDFTGLAIVAGALSVGIGIGLQNIANNVVSGIILLLEKPIKPGDRISFGEIEGYVKRVRIRSTRVTTLAKEDVIIPNADLISKNVTNYMFHDKYWRVTCQVGVAYGSDVELVRKTLLEVAASHKEVLQDPPNEPVVLFKEFSGSSLNFEIWCIIRDVNKKNYITSDLYFAIDKAFHKNNIEIAFPQQDIHIKDWPVPTSTSKTEE